VRNCPRVPHLARFARQGAHDLISDIVQDLDVVVPPTGATSASELKEIEVPLRPRGMCGLD
jgi:hypothetical protein